MNGKKEETFMICEKNGQKITFEHCRNDIPKTRTHPEALPTNAETNTVYPDFKS